MKRQSKTFKADSWAGVAASIQAFVETIARTNPEAFTTGAYIFGHTFPVTVTIEVGQSKVWDVFVDGEACFEGVRATSRQDALRLAGEALDVPEGCKIEVRPALTVGRP